MVEISEVFGYITGIAGVALATYSIIKQQKLEERLKEKEKLKAFSKKIQKNLIPRIDDVIDNIKNPTNNVDLFFQLQGLSQNVVSKAFDEKEEIVRINTEITIDLLETLDNTRERDRNKTITISNENKEYIIKCFEEGKCDFIGLDAYIPNDNMSYSLGTDILLDIKYMLLNLDELEKEFGSIVEEFKPDLFIDLKGCVIGTFKTIVNHAIDSKEIEIDITKFDKSEDIGLWIYSKAIGRDELELYAVNLVELETHLDTFRESLLTTSYT